MPEIRYKLCMGCMEQKDTDGVCPNCGYSPDTPSLPAYLPPETILNDRYILGKLLRYNGEGAEYIGFDTVTSSKVTIREYMPDTLCSRNRESSVISVKQNCVAQYKAFMSEFVELNKMLAKMRTLSHINPPLDMFGDNNTGYVVFRYVEGINLAKYLKENAGELSWAQVKQMFPPIFTTLSLVHNAGLVHRGISPENIIVTDKNELKIIGFCIADSRTANTELASEIYHGYAAPEQYSSSNWQGTWTDVYGICALLYRILTGTAPMDAMERVANDTLAEPRALNKNIPANVSKVIMNGMNLSGDLRIQTVTELVTQLFEEPDFNKTKTVTATQTITIPKLHSTKGEAEQRENTVKKSSRPSRHKVFIAAASITAVVLFIGMTVLISVLDDNSSNIINALPTVTNASAETTEDLSASVTGEDGQASVTTAATNPGGALTLPTLPEMTTAESQTTASETKQPFKPGTTVYIMNDLVGKFYDTVKNTSISENLTIIPEYVYTDEYEKGMIFEQSIAKGENYEKGAEVTLKISMGPPKVMVPEFTGLNKKDYFEILNAAGIKYEEIGYETEETLNDYVMWISIEPGEYIDLEAGDVLKVYVAVNPENTAPSETTATETEATEESSTPWVTTVPPSPDDMTGSRDTEEPDIIITDDY